MTDMDKTLSLVNQVWPPLQESLRELRLEQLLPDVQTIIAECEKQKMSVENTLRVVFGVALQRRKNHRQEMQLTMARFPTPASIENFDFTKIDQHSQQSLAALANCSWINVGDSVFLQGPSGVGKTHLAVALGKRAIAQGYRTLFVEAKTLLGEMRYWQQTGILNNKLKQLNQVKLLILDDVGNKDNPDPEDCILFSALIRSRYSARRSCIITASTMPMEWFTPRPDQFPTLVAAVDRFVHYCCFVRIQGKSYRLEAFQNRNREGLGDDYALLTGQADSLTVEALANDKGTATDTVR